MRGGGARVLIVEDEPGIVRALKTNLGAHGFQVETAGSGAQAMETYARRRPDLILLDLGLPDMDGTDIISLVRKETHTPIIVLSVREAERDKVKALAMGADDYLTKPIGPDELLARVRVALRHAARPQSGADAVIKSGDLEIDFERRQVKLAGVEVRLTPTEFDLLKAFMQHMDRIMTDRMLLQEVWGADYGDEAHYLHVYIARLRKKIEADPRRPARLLTEPGVGYRFVSED
jgi:two-component system, OmpR family, KDP operon response regulator KdpE